MRAAARVRERRACTTIARSQKSEPVKKNMRVLTS
jgi:hypothetical protein